MSKTRNTNTLSRDAFIMVNKRLAKKVGFIAAGLLGELISRRNYFEKRDMIKNGEFFCTVADIEEATGLSRHEQATARKALVDNGILSVEKRGLPARNWYGIDDDFIDQILLSTDSAPTPTDDNDKEDSDNKSSAFRMSSEPKCGRLDSRNAAHINNNNNNNNKKQQANTIKAFPEEKPKRTLRVSVSREIAPKKREKKVLRVSESDMMIYRKLRRLIQHSPFSHRVPEGGIGVTKLILHLVEHAKQMMDGTWAKSRLWDAKWIKQRRIQFPQNEMTERDVYHYLRNALDNFAKMHVDGFFPLDKSRLPKSMDLWMYNPRTQKSFMLDNACNVPTMLKEQATTQSISVSREGLTALEIETFDNLYTARFAEQGWYPRDVYYADMRRVLDYTRENGEDLKRVNHGRSGYGTVIGGGAYLRSLERYLEEGGDLYRVHIGEGKKWRNLCNWFAEQGIVFEPTEEDKLAALEAAKKRGVALRQKTWQTFVNQFASHLKNDEEAVVRAVACEWQHSHGWQYVPVEILVKWGDAYNGAVDEANMIPSSDLAALRAAHPEITPCVSRMHDRPRIAKSSKGKRTDSHGKEAGDAVPQSGPDMLQQARVVLDTMQTFGQQQQTDVVALPTIDIDAKVDLWREVVRRARQFGDVETLERTAREMDELAMRLYHTSGDAWDESEQYERYMDLKGSIPLYIGEALEEAERNPRKVPISLFSVQSVATA